MTPVGFVQVAEEVKVCTEAIPPRPPAPEPYEIVSPLSPNVTVPFAPTGLTFICFYFAHGLGLSDLTLLYAVT